MSLNISFKNFEAAKQEYSNVRLQPCAEKVVFKIEGFSREWICRSLTSFESYSSAAIFPIV